MPIEPLPLPVIPPAPQRSDPSTFEVRNDAAVEFQFNVLPPWIEEQVNRTFKNALESAQYAAESEADADRAEAAADAASQAAGATEWVSGKSYAIGDVVWSPIDMQSYRARAATYGRLDPSLDPANWEQIGGVHQGGSASLSRYDLGVFINQTALDLAQRQVFRLNVSGVSTITLVNPPAANRAMTVVIHLVGSSGSVNWPSNIEWDDGPPELGDNFTRVVLFWDGDRWTGFQGAAR